MDESTLLIKSAAAPKLGNKAKEQLREVDEYTKMVAPLTRDIFDMGFIQQVTTPANQFDQTIRVAQQAPPNPYGYMTSTSPLSAAQIISPQNQY